MTWVDDLDWTAVIVGVEEGVRIVLWSKESLGLVDKGVSLIGNSFFYWTWESWIMFGREIVHPSGSP